MILSATAIDHLNLDCRDFEETIQFYQSVFGFRILHDQRATHNCVILGNAGIKLCFYQVYTLEMGQGLNHLGFHIQNFEQIEATCRQHNLTLLYGGVTKTWEHSRSMYIEDPNGYEIELAEVSGGGL
jgi:lactoylglutathione lyase